MGYTIKFKPDGATAMIRDGQTILDAAQSAGVHIQVSCNCEGKCKKCRVIVEEGEFETRMPKQDGAHLACQTYPKSDAVVFIPEESRLGRHQILEHIEVHERREVSGDAFFAVDIGTTTVAASLIDASDGAIADTASAYNKQVSIGADVLSRIDYAKSGGLGKLQKLEVETINELLEKLMGRSNLSSGRIKEIITSGNTVMTYLLVGRDPSEIQRNVQIPRFKMPVSANAREIGINLEAPVYCIPGVGSYVGGDITAGILASGMHKAEGVSMLIDVGTNGEIALGNRDWMVAASTSAGPAFEGAQTTSGMRAASGAIEEVKIKGDYEVEFSAIDNYKPRGICGSGFIDAVAQMFLSGAIDHKGRIDLSIDSKRVRKAKNTSEFVIAWAGETSLGRDIVITEKDIENIIYTKAAIYAGASALAKVGVPFGGLERVYIAGGFGHYIRIDNAIAIGLLPDLPKERFAFIGNASLAGAIKVAKEGRGEVEAIARKTTYIDLSSDKSFTEEYMGAIFLPHANPDLFPSVEERLP